MSFPDLDADHTICHIQIVREIAEEPDYWNAVHSYPTMSEANKYAAGVWKKARAPEKILKWLGKYHGWMRG